MKCMEKVDTDPKQIPAATRRRTLYVPRFEVLVTRRIKRDETRQCGVIRLASPVSGLIKPVFSQDIN
jgi:hypothetical protein